MAQKRRGRPPGKTKERDPVIGARIPKDLLESLEDLAKERGRALSAQTLSAEVRDALQFWVNRHEISRRHNSRLGMTIAVLADHVEDITEKSWLEDPLTRQVVGEHVGELVSHILSPLSEPVAVPADVKEEAGLILAVLKHVIPRPGSRRLAGTVILDDPGFATFLQGVAREEGVPSNVETRPVLVAQREQDDKAWADARSTGTAKAFADYLEKFTDSKGRCFGRHAAKARKRLAAFEQHKGRK
jgi:hypothetical protein